MVGSSLALPRFLARQDRYQPQVCPFRGPESQGIGTRQAGGLCHSDLELDGFVQMSTGSRGLVDAMQEFSRRRFLGAAAGAGLSVGCVTPPQAPSYAEGAAFSNPRMILKWGGLGKGTALGVDLLSEVFEGGGGLRGRGKLRKLLPGSQNCVELPSPPPSNAETRAVRPGLKTLGFTSGSGTRPAVSS